MFARSRRGLWLMSAAGIGTDARRPAQQADQAGRARRFPDRRLGLPAGGISGAAAEGPEDKGIEVDIVNAGVSGDTTSGGRDRLDWSIPEGTEAVIVELGANDALRGIDPEVDARRAERHPQEAEGAQDRGDAVRHVRAAELRRRLCCEVQRDLSGSCESIRRAAVSVFPRRRAADAKLNQPDGMHPTAEGVDIIVQRILPTVEAFLKDLWAAQLKRSSA